jgi:hypothetical protein
MAATATLESQLYHGQQNEPIPTQTARIKTFNVRAVDDEPMTLTGTIAVAGIPGITFAGVVVGLSHGVEDKIPIRSFPSVFESILDLSRRSG